jgi:hypothetical protein
MLALSSSASWRTPDGDGTLLVIGDSLRRQHDNGNQHDHGPLPLVLVSGASGLQGTVTSWRRRNPDVEPAAEHDGKVGVHRTASARSTGKLEL